MLWDRDKVLCYKPKSACETCPEKFQGKKMGVKGDEVDWADKATRRKQQEEYREQHPERIQETVRKFKERYPTYWRDVMRARRKAAKDKKAREALIESSKGKIR